jgi:radical SAM protein with 4Fe4S-binding SPASM domain
MGDILNKKEGVSTIDELVKDFAPSQKQFFWQSYGWFFAAQAVDRLEQRGEWRLPFSKGCMIGASEGHVGPNGDISICHKAQGGHAFVIGNVNSGEFDLEQVYDLERWLHHHKKCSSCFLQRFCDLCYEKLDGDPSKLAYSRERYCDFMQQSLRVIFHRMLEVMDKNPDLWDEAVRYINRRVETERRSRNAIS